MYEVSQHVNNYSKCTRLEFYVLLTVNRSLHFPQTLTFPGCNGQTHWWASPLPFCPQTYFLHWQFANKQAHSCTIGICAFVSQMKYVSNFKSRLSCWLWITITTKSKACWSVLMFFNPIQPELFEGGLAWGVGEAEAESARSLYR